MLLKDMQHQSLWRRLLLQKMLSHNGGHEISCHLWNSKRSTASSQKPIALPYPEPHLAQTVS
jgi:hypothetical protein